MFEKEAYEYGKEKIDLATSMMNPQIETATRQGFKDGAEYGYKKANEEHKEKCKTAYIKGIRTMANALKDYDRTDGAWTDYFENTVDKVLKELLGQDIKDGSQEAYKELCENYSSNKSLYTDGFSDGYKECQKEWKRYEEENMVENPYKWYYVKDGDLPKVDNKIVLCVCGNGYIDGKRNYKLKLLTRKEFPLFQPVYAWKEIVPPKEIE